MTLARHKNPTAEQNIVLTHLLLRVVQMGIKADTPRELISQAKDIMLRHHELKSQTASLGAQVNALQAEHHHKVVILITF